MSKFKGIPVGSTFVDLGYDSWVKDGRRPRCQVDIFVADYPYSNYDGIRDAKPSIEEVEYAIKWIAENENLPKLNTYTRAQIGVLQDRIWLLMEQGQNIDPRNSDCCSSSGPGMDF